MIRKLFLFIVFINLFLYFFIGSLSLLNLEDFEVFFFDFDLFVILFINIDIVGKLE